MQMHVHSGCQVSTKTIRRNTQCPEARNKIQSQRIIRQRSIHVPFAVASRARPVKKDKEIDEEEELDGEDEEEFDDLDAPDDPSALSTQQVQSLMNVVCQDTEVAEIQLQVGSFALKLRRKIEDANAASAYAPSINGTGPAPYIEQAFQSTASMDQEQIAAPQSNDNGHTSSTDEEDHDENLVFLGAPKVGVLRRHRFVKGKKVGKAPLVEVGAKVKKGQLLAFIEQLGTHVPISAPQAGEIVSIECEEGSPVEYKEVIFELAPFFGGHIIGDKKYA